MVKRKREEAREATKALGAKSAKVAEPAATNKTKKTSQKSSAVENAGPDTASLAQHSVDEGQHVSLQVITGSYERVLHGFAATISTAAIGNSVHGQDSSADEPTFSDTFLFAAHTSALRCLALSPPTESHKRILATGSTDERINLYNLSTSPPIVGSKPRLPTLTQTSVLENPRNRELGSLLHHTSGVNKLHFPTRGKLFSAADDSTIAISRTRDWAVMSTIKAPIPKALGRPSGDTAGPGEIPAGVNDFAIHPSMKVMVSVSKGERCMRLWNLVTGKKAGVLNFDKDLLQAVGETRYSSGEGRKVLWSEDGEEYAVGFERGAAIYGMDSVPKAVVQTTPPTKLHQMRYVPLTEGKRILAVSTEDGKIVFFDTQETVAPVANGKAASALPRCKAIAQLGGRATDSTGRIKDFDIVKTPNAATLLFLTGSSDGAVRIWTVRSSDLDEAATSDSTTKEPLQVGGLIGTHETGHRITCLSAFVLDGPSEEADGTDDDEAAGAEVEGEDSSSSDSE